MYVSRHAFEDRPAADTALASGGMPGDAAALAAAFLALDDGATDGRALIERAVRALPGRIAAVSSFGAESVLLLALIAEVDRGLPVLFLETDRHFPETLAYRDTVARTLGLTDVRDIRPDTREAADQDPTGELWYYDPDACCGLRKVRPLDRALDGFDAWITGRKRHQADTRHALSLVERTPDRLKINPLAAWSADEIEAEIGRRGLPRSPLVARGYRSIGCAPCTRPVRDGEDDRAGRWAGLRKVECGIHLPA